MVFQNLCSFLCINFHWHTAALWLLELDDVELGDVVTQKYHCSCVIMLPHLIPDIPPLMEFLHFGPKKGKGPNSRCSLLPVTSAALPPQEAQETCTCITLKQGSTLSQSLSPVAVTPHVAWHLGTPSHLFYPLLSISSSD